MAFSSVPVIQNQYIICSKKIILLSDNTFDGFRIFK